MDVVLYLLELFLVLCLVGLSQENALKNHHDEIKELSNQQRASDVRGHSNTVTYSLLGDGIEEHLPRKTIENPHISALRMRTAGSRSYYAKKDVLRERLDDTSIKGSKHADNTREQPKPSKIPEEGKSKQNARSKSSIRKNNRHTNAMLDDSNSHRRIESLQRKPLNAKFLSDSKPLASHNAGTCSSGNCKRQLCPWSVEWNTDFNRSPIRIPEVSCVGQTCNITSYLMKNHVGFRYFQRKTECATVTTDISVFIHDYESTLSVPVACVCQYRGNPATSADQEGQSKGGQSNLAYKNLSQTGKMTPIVKLDKMEDLDGIHPVILEHVLPFHHRHRNRKLREHEENESSGKQSKKGRRHELTHNHDVKLEEATENV